MDAIATAATLASAAITGSTLTPHPSRGACLSQALVTNEENNLMGSYVTGSTSLDGLLAWLAVIAARHNVNPLAVMVDNVPPSWDTANLSKFEKKLMAVFGVIWVGQDRFHVCHSFSVHFNNMHSLFRTLIIVQWRNATTFLDGRLEQRGVVLYSIWGGIIIK